jgi:hypothetical protein
MKSMLDASPSEIHWARQTDNTSDVVAQRAEKSHGASTFLESHASISVVGDGDWLPESPVPPTTEISGGPEAGSRERSRLTIG